MTLPLEITLGEARRKVLLRAGVAESSAHNENLQPIIDEYIRDAHSYYFQSAQWFSIHKRTSIALEASVQDYDWPDDVAPGRISSLHAESTDDDRPRYLEPAPTPLDRYDASEGTSETPRYYEYIDGVIRIWPVLSNIDTYDTLVIDYDEREADLVSDSDRFQVDSNLVVLRATVDVKVHLSLPGIRASETRLAQMEQRVLPKQNNRKSVQMGAHARPALYYNRYARGTRRNYNYRGGASLLGGWIDYDTI